MAKESRPLKKAATPRPKAQVLKLGEHYKKAIKRSLAKRKPPEGWPK
jgi:hypothetical protein